MSEDTAKDLARLQRRLEASDETITDLELQIEDLECELATRPDLSPYDMPAEVVNVLTKQLVGWPAPRWCELAGRIEAHVHRSVPSAGLVKAEG